MSSIIFMGTPDFSVVVLKGLLAAGYDIKAVVTQPDKPVGRKHKLTASPVKAFASEAGLEVLQPAKISGSPEAARIQALQPDFIITAAFGQFLPMSVLKAAKIAAVNVHGSLLPKYRGGAPIQMAIMNGEKETGITIMYMAKKMDAGDMLAQAAIPIEATDTSGTVFEKLSQVGSKLLLETLPKIAAGTITPTAQDPDKVTVAYNLTPEQEVLDFTHTASQLDRQIRALNPDPGAYTYFEGQRLKVWLAKVVAVPNDGALPGTVLVKSKKELIISTGSASESLALLELQPAGKAKMPIAAFLNGLGQQLTVGTPFIQKIPGGGAHR
ncbi:MAG: methionyl-tRNA formyltransferase [Lactobacillus sp.]|nr:methionyl-tRNA formyltransferase [Lactobacillus sp.]